MRLTRKDGTYKEYIGDENITIGERSWDNALTKKLGQLEDIEEELCIDLTTLYELLVRGCYYKCDNEILYTFGDVDVSNKCIHNVYNKELLFQDYGKTWALTREELE